MTQLHKITILAAMALLVMPAASVRAQEVIENDTADNGIFQQNIRDIYLQTRYRPRENDTLFYNLPRWCRLYFGVGGGMHGVYDDTENRISGSASAYIGYSFTPIHSIRAQITTIFYKPVAIGSTQVKVGLEADYVANLSNFAVGFNPYRILDVSTVIGVGVQLSSNSLEHNALPYGKFGLHFNLHVTSNTSVYLEPYVGIQQSMPSLTGRDNQSGWNLMYGVSGGVDINMLGNYRRQKNYDPYFNHWFFDAALGAHMNSFQSMPQTYGIGYEIAVGRWFNHILGARLGVSAVNNYWRIGYQDGNSVANLQATVTGRFEFVVNPLYFFPSWYKKKGGHDFDFNISGGLEAGMNIKSPSVGEGNRNGVSGKRTCTCYAPTIAAQVLYRVENPGTYVFFEPRFTLVSNLNSGGQAQWAGKDKSFTFSLGTRIYFLRKSARNVSLEEFKPHFWTGMSIGGARWNYTEKVNGAGFNPHLDFNFGYDYRPLASFRLQLGWERFGNSCYSTTHEEAYDVVDLRLAYMLSFNNLFQGYNSQRKFNFFWTVGPAASFIISENTSDKTRVTPAINTSCMATYRVARSWDINVEASGQWNFLPDATPNLVTRINQLKYAVAVGMCYHFDQDRLRSIFQKHGKK